jgi:hypothetical protein
LRGRCSSRAGGAVMSLRAHGVGVAILLLVARPHRIPSLCHCNREESPCGTKHTECDILYCGVTKSLSQIAASDYRTPRNDTNINFCDRETSLEQLIGTIYENTAQTMFGRHSFGLDHPALHLFP